MDKLKIGQLITEPQVRDAIHVAIAPVVAGMILHPGQHVGLDDGKAVVRQGIGLVGIVDPFLLNPVYPGARFWLFLYPGSITSLAHHWTHPAFEAPADPLDQTARNASIKWIEAFAAKNDLTYNRVMTGAKAYLLDGDYISEQWLEGEGVPDEFWTHYERVEGITVPESERGSFFTCSC